jgi:hypothetical protein
MLYLALDLFSFLAFSGLVFYASTQTLEAENDPNMRTSTTNLDAMHYHDQSIICLALWLEAHRRLESSRFRWSGFLV